MADKLHTFVRTLKARTDEGKVNWEPMVEEGIYQAAFPDYLVRIWMRPSHHVDDDSCISILDKDGTLIEEFDDTVLTASGFQEAYALMKELHRLARRRAMGLDKALDELIAALGPSKPEPTSVRPGSADFSQEITDDDVPF